MLESLELTEIELKEFKTQFEQNDQFANHINIKLDELNIGYAKASMKIEAFHLNGAGVIQGGALFTLADFVFGAASNTHGLLSLGINTSMNFIKGAKKGETVTAICKNKNQGHKLGVYDVDIFNDKEELIATFCGLNYLKQQKLF